MTETVTPELDLEKMQRDISIIRETNAALVSEIEQMGGGLDLSLARFEHLIEELQQLGVITEAQRWTEQLKWELGLKTQLVNIRSQLQEMHAHRPEARRGMVKPPEKKLWTPGT